MKDLIINLQICCTNKKNIPKKNSFKKWIKKTLFKKKKILLLLE